MGGEYSREDYKNQLQERDRRFDNFLRESIPSECPEGTVRCPDGQCVPPERVPFDCDPRDLVGNISFQQSLPGALVRTAEKDHFGFYVQDSYRPLPNLSLNVGLRFDRDEAEADGWEIFDPAVQGQRFLDFLLVGSGKTFEQIVEETQQGQVEPVSVGEVYNMQVLNPDMRFDVNGDNRDIDHCGSNFGAIDRFNNSLITGFLVNENGTYTLIGDETLDDNGNGIPDYREPDAMPEDFFKFLDVAGKSVCLGGPSAGAPCDLANGNDDCPVSICGTSDGTVRFDPALAGQMITTSGEYGNPADCNGDLLCDQLLYVSDGNATGNTNGDAVSQNPNCDRLNEDALTALSVYSRHQLDVENTVGVSTFASGVQPGTVREEERFTITSNNLAPRIIHP
jgi:hypothetical protein